MAAVINNETPKTATLDDVIAAVSATSADTQNFLSKELLSDVNIKKSFIDPFIKELTKVVIPVKINIAPMPTAESKLDSAKDKNDLEYFFGETLKYLGAIAANTGSKDGGVKPEKPKGTTGFAEILNQTAVGLDKLAGAIVKYADKKVVAGAAVLSLTVASAIIAIGKAVKIGWSDVSLAAASAAAIGITGIGFGLSKIGKLNAKQTAMNALALAATAPAIVVLGPAIKTGFSGVPIMATLAAAGAITAIGWALRASSKLSPGQVAKMGLAYMAFAPAIALLGLSLRIGWSTVKPETVIIASFGATAMAGVAKIMSKISIGQAVKGAAGLALMGASLIPLAFSLQIASNANISWKSLAQLGVAILGLGTLAAAAGALVGLIAPGALAFTLLGLSLIPLAYGMEQLASIPFDWGQMEQVATALLGLIGIASLAGLASPLIGLAGLAFMSLGTGLYIMGTALSNPAWASAETTAGYVTKALETLYDGLSIKHILFFGPYGLALLPFASALNIMGSAFFKLSNVAKSINLDEVAKFVAAALNRFSEIEVASPKKLMAITQAAKSFAESMFMLASVKDKIISMRDISDEDIEGVKRFGTLIEGFTKQLKNINEGGIGAALSNLLSSAFNIKSIEQFLGIRDELIKVGEIDYTRYAVNMDSFGVLLRKLTGLVNDINKFGGGFWGAIGNFVSSGFNVNSIQEFLNLVDPIKSAFEKISTITIDESQVDSFGRMVKSLLGGLMTLDGPGVGDMFLSFFGGGKEREIKNLCNMMDMVFNSMRPIQYIGEGMLKFQQALSNIGSDSSIPEAIKRLNDINRLDANKLEAVTKVSRIGPVARDKSITESIGSFFNGAGNEKQETSTIPAANYNEQLSTIITELKNVTKAAASSNIVIAESPARSYLDY